VAAFRDGDQVSHPVRKTLQSGLGLISALLIASCGGGGGSNSTVPTSGSVLYTIGGNVYGLSGSGLTLQNNGGDNLSVTASGAFTFATALSSGVSYNVSVLTQPSSTSQTCVVADGSGTIQGQSIGNIAVTCTNKTSATDTIGGTVVGLVGSGLVLQDSGTDNLSIPANGAFTFATPLSSGQPYAVSVLSPPIDPYQDCTVSAGTGTTAASDVTNVLVSCTVNSNPTFSIGGTVSGVSGSGATLVLLNNGRDNLNITADGPFKFDLPIPAGSFYSVSVNPVSTSESLTCALANPNGIVSGNVTDIAVTCTGNAAPATGSVNVVVTGLADVGLALQDNGADTISVSPGSGPVSATFPTVLAVGATYDVTVLTQPTGQTCSVPNGTGTVAAITNSVSVTCATNPTGPTALNGPEGVIVQGDQLFVANFNSNQVLVYSIQYTANNQVSGLTQLVNITANISSPTRLALDANGYLYVANTAANDVTVYNGSDDYQAVYTISSPNVDRPLGVALDSSGNVYVGNNASNTISVFTPNTAGNPAAGFTEADFSPLSTDSADDAFQAPGVIFDVSFQSTEYLFVGLGPSGGNSSVIEYTAPLTGESIPNFDANGTDDGEPCSGSIPQGPVGIALFVAPPSAAAPIPSYLYVDNLYNGTVYQYPASDFFGEELAPCPVPVTNNTGMNSPQGVAVDSFGNVFVSNAGTTGTNANSIAVYAGGASFTATAPPYFIYAP
jgi:hypothetical protein